MAFIGVTYQNEIKVFIDKLIFPTTHPYIGPTYFYNILTIQFYKSSGKIIE